MGHLVYFLEVKGNIRFFRDFPLTVLCRVLPLALDELYLVLKSRDFLEASK